MDIANFLGRLHPLVVHLPIGFLLLGGVFYFVGKTKQYSFLHKALPLTFLLSTLSAGGAAFFGWLLAGEGDYDGDTLFWHQWLGIGVALFSLVLFGLSVWREKIPASLVVIAMGLLGYTGHLGGGLTHGADYLIQPLLGDPITNEMTLPEPNDSIEVYTHLIHNIFKEIT